MKKIAVIGSGTMGLDIAQAFARSGFSVIVNDISVEIIDKAKNRLNNSLDKLVSKGKMDDAKKSEIIKNMTFTTELTDLADVDVVVEAALENLDIKKKIFSKLDDICKPETIFSTNTSSISITAIGADTKRADKFIGMHFFNPATVLKLVEIIRGMGTSDETYQAIYELTLAINKEPVEVEEAPGFVVNKILIPMVNEAIDLLYTGVATAEGIDKSMKYGAAHPMGPLALADLIGLDVVLAVMDTLFAETHDSKYRASLLLRKMVYSGNLGRKTGQGFFNYSK